MSRLRGVFVGVVWGALSACNCTSEVTVPCSSKSDCAATEVCVNGTCVSEGDGGTGPDGGTIVTGCSPANTDNATRDSDCDGLSDGEEYNTSYADNAKTDPCNADSDSDGINDGLEMGRTSSLNTTCGFVGDADPFSKSDPTVADTDGDGLSDSQEDLNKNGRVEPGESDPLRKDSDCDGLFDAEELNATYGCKTDPLKIDTDGDGIRDGVEAGLSAPGADPTLCAYAASTFDADTTTTTSACSADSDGDGIMDGAEDLDQNGRVDTGELDPNLASDGTGPAQHACSSANLRPINFHSNGSSDVQVALVPTFTEVSKLVDSSSIERGLIFYDAANQIGGLVLSKGPAGASATDEETDARSRLNGAGTISGAITQTFTTWDGFGSAVRATYDQSSNGDLKAQLNALAQAFLGQSTTGLLPGAAGVTGPFTIQAEYVWRTSTRAVVLLAITPTSAFTGARLFQMDDVGGGSALAQFGDFSGTQCEVFTTQGNATVDFIFVVDNSGSMSTYQTAVGNVGNLFATKLGNAGLDWRVAAIATDGASSRPFGTTVDTAYLTSFGTSGGSTERQLQYGRSKVQAMLPKAANSPSAIRTSADLHLILLGDADDQSSASAATYSTFFGDYDSAGSKAVVHGIVCPQGQGCGETQANPRKNLAVIAATGGVLGDINSAQPVGNPQISATLDAILSAAIAGTGKQLQKPPISATIKIAIEAGGTVGTCNTSDVPRDRTNGFDFDSATRRVVFFGACRPAGPGKKVAVSYKFWNDGSPDPGGDPCGNKCVAPFVCNPATGQCICPSDCGGCPSNQTCEPVSCSCGPGIG